MIIGAGKSLDVLAARQSCFREKEQDLLLPGKSFECLTGLDFLEKLQHEFGVGDV
jgi:hypothetical protein